MIRRRRSCRSFAGVPVADDVLEKIKALSMKPLYPDIQVHWEIVDREQVKCICPWTTPQLITIYSEVKDGYLENVGFLFQQMDLWLQSMDLGVCWLGMGKLAPQTARSVDGMEFVIMLAFGHPKSEFLREDIREFKRKTLTDISDREDPRLESARLAPSSVNSQPWYFIHESDTIHVYCVQQGILKNKPMGYMNRIDMGIALAHLYVANPESFSFFKADQCQTVKGYGYIGSVTL